MYRAAALHGDLATLNTLGWLGVPWCVEGDVGKALQERCGLPALRWLVEHMRPCTVLCAAV